MISILKNDFMRVSITVIFVFVLFCSLDGHSATNDKDVNVVDLNKEYSVADFIEDNYYTVKYYVPKSGKVRINILDCNPDGLYNYYNISDGHLNNPSGLEAQWIEYVDSMTTGWISVEAGTHYFCFSKMHYGNAANYLGVLVIEYEAVDDYIGEIENNDTFENANIIESGKTYEGNYSHNVHESNYSLDIDCYSFSLEKNSAVLLDLKVLSDNWDGKLYADLFKVNDAGNKELVYSLNKWSENEVNKLRLPAGEYYFEMKVSSYNTREYSLRLDVTDEEGLNVENEFNDFKRNANAISTNVKYTGNLFEDEDVDWYEVNVPVKSKISASFWIPEQLGKDLISITLFDEKSNQLSEKNTTNNKYLVTPEKVVPIGNYYIRVQNIGGISSVHDYQIRVNVTCVTHRLESNIITKADYGISGEKEVWCNVCSYKENIKIPALVVKPVTNLKAKMLNNTSFNISWTKSKGADAYNVYMKKGNGNFYKKITTTKNAYKISKLSRGVKYTFAIVPCVKVDGQYKEISSSIKEISKYTLAKVKNVSINKSSNSKAKVKWKGINGETGYQIARAKSKNGTYKIISTVKQSSYKWPSTTVKTSKNAAYYYKVRAYKTEGKTKIYGPWSEKKLYKLK